MTTEGATPINYSTSEIAKLVGVHPNTVRFYEAIQYLPPVSRQANAYRVFTDIHLAQLKLIALAQRCGIVQHNLRKKAIELILLCAVGEYEQAFLKAEAYHIFICTEKERAKEAVRIVQGLLDVADKNTPPTTLTRKQTAQLLDITVDALRNWELNGLIDIPRKVNGYRLYTEKEIKELKIIRALREAGYSLTAILRMLTRLRTCAKPDLQTALDTPDPEDDIVYVTDHLLTSLEVAERDAADIIVHIAAIKS